MITASFSSTVAIECETSASGQRQHAPFGFSQWTQWPGYALISETMTGPSDACNPWRSRAVPGDAKSRSLLDDDTERDQHRSGAPSPHTVGVGSDTQRNRWVLHLLDSQDRVYELPLSSATTPAFPVKEE